MSVISSRSEDGKDLILKVSGKFDFGVHSDFRNAYKDETVSGQFCVDLAETNYLDSSALGMLLLLKKHAESVSASVTIVNTGADIKEIMLIASFDKLFNIS